VSALRLEHWVIAALLATALLLWVRLRWNAGRGHRRAVARAARAGAGESEAEWMLESEGYTIVDRQVRCIWWMEVDGVEEEVELRADLLVEKDGERFIAEVKTGINAPNPTFPPTRRQLLEYRLAFDPYRLLLVDADAGEIREVCFPRAMAR